MFFRTNVIRLLGSIEAEFYPPLAKTKTNEQPFNDPHLHVTLWIMFVLFLLNTAGNALSTNGLEKLLFTPITLLLAFFSLVLALSKVQKPSWR